MPEPRHGLFSVEMEWTKWEITERVTGLQLLTQAEVEC